MFFKYRHFMHQFTNIIWRGSHLRVATVHLCFVRLRALTVAFITRS